MSQDGVTVKTIEDQRRKGWPDFHPEDYCHQCGRPNMLWFAPEWRVLVGSYAGILCPVCFGKLDPHALWTVTRFAPHPIAQETLLADVLKSCTNLSHDALRVARCILDAGFQRSGEVEA